MVTNCPRKGLAQHKHLHDWSQARGLCPSSGTASCGRQATSLLLDGLPDRLSFRLIYRRPGPSAGVRGGAPAQVAGACGCR